MRKIINILLIIFIIITAIRLVDHLRETLK